MVGVNNLCTVHNVHRNNLSRYTKITANRSAGPYNRAVKHRAHVCQFLIHRGGGKLGPCSGKALPGRSAEETTSTPSRPRGAARAARRSGNCRVRIAPLGWILSGRGRAHRSDGAVPTRIHLRLRNLGRPKGLREFVAVVHPFSEGS